MSIFTFFLKFVGFFFQSQQNYKIYIRKYKFFFNAFDLFIIIFTSFYFCKVNSLIYQYSRKYIDLYMNEKYKNLLAEHNKFIKDEIMMIENGARLSSIHREIKPKERELRGELMQLAKQVAQSGELHVDLWPDFKNFLTILVKETLDRFNNQYKDSKSFEEEKEVILQYLIFFDKAPFTIQRITELTLEPEKYYKSCKKLLYAYERLVNVADPEDK